MPSIGFIPAIRDPASSPLGAEPAFREVEGNDEVTSDRVADAYAVVASAHHAQSTVHKRRSISLRSAGSRSCNDPNTSANAVLEPAHRTDSANFRMSAMSGKPTLVKSSLESSLDTLNQPHRRSHVSPIGGRANLFAGPQTHNRQSAPAADG